jgi:hypothetical protein
MDEYHEKLARFYTILYFIFTGPFILITSILVDSFVFFYNLYTISDDANDKIDQVLITPETIEVFKRCQEQVLKEHRKES